MFTKLVRIGRDAELKNTQSGTAVLKFPAVYDVGYGDNKEAQWLDVAMFGQRAEKLAQYFTKGNQIVIYADDLKVNVYQKNDGSTGHSLQCKLVDFAFAGGSSQQQQRPAQQQAPQQQVQQPNFENDASWDDVPF